MILILNRVEVLKFRMSMLEPIPANTYTPRYPKHVWSPAGGWYAQPKNWKVNTAVMGSVIIGLTAFMWSVSADREYRTKFPDPDKFYPSRQYVYSGKLLWTMLTYRSWSKQIIEHEKEIKKESSS
jgi:hypothetical protein